MLKNPLHVTCDLQRVFQHVCDLTRFSILSFQTYKKFWKSSKLMDLLYENGFLGWGQFLQISSPSWKPTLCNYKKLFFTATSNWFWFHWGKEENWNFCKSPSAISGRNWIIGFELKILMHHHHPMSNFYQCT